MNMNTIFEYAVGRVEIFLSQERWMSL